MKIVTDMVNVEAFSCPFFLNFPHQKCEILLLSNVVNYDCYSDLVLNYNFFVTNLMHIHIVDGLLFQQSFTTYNK